MLRDSYHLVFVVSGWLLHKSHIFRIRLSIIPPSSRFVLSCLKFRNILREEQTSGIRIDLEQVFIFDADRVRKMPSETHSRAGISYLRKFSAKEAVESRNFIDEVCQTRRYPSAAAR